MITEAELYLALRRLQQIGEQHAKRLGRRTGLTPLQLLVLRAIPELGAATIGQLAARLNLSQATLTTVLDRMEERGLLQRVRDQDDRRKVRLLLSEAGREQSAAEPALLPEGFMARFSALSEWERQQLYAALLRLGMLMDETSPTEAASRGHG